MFRAIPTRTRRHSTRTFNRCSSTSHPKRDRSCSEGGTWVRPRRLPESYPEETVRSGLSESMKARCGRPDMPGQEDSNVCEADGSDHIVWIIVDSESAECGARSD